MALTSQKGVLLAQGPLYRCGHLNRPSHKDPEGLALHEPDQGARSCSHGQPVPAYLACCTGHLSGFPRNTCRRTRGLMKYTRLTRARGT